MARGLALPEDLVPECLLGSRNHRTQESLICGVAADARDARLIFDGAIVPRRTLPFCTKPCKAC